MTNNTTLLTPFLYVVLAGFAVGAWAQDTTTIANTTNGCIDSTFKSYTPSVTNPVSILIDRRLNVDPGPCTTADMNSASCSIDVGAGYLIANVTTGQIGNAPSCSWNCAAAGCGTIITDGSIGLPIELMDFSIEVASSPADQ